ncbi:MAG: hypothetical protein ACRDVN_02260 [Jiangellaceae bacterium]
MRSVKTHRPETCGHCIYAGRVEEEYVTNTAAVPHDRRDLLSISPVAAEAAALRA